MMMENKDLTLLPKPVLLRNTTSNEYEGEGVEMATGIAWDDCAKVIDSLDAVDCVIKEIASDDDTVATFESDDETDSQEEECLSIMPFRILGTLRSDDDCQRTENTIGECSCSCCDNNDDQRQQRVLSPINMESLQYFFPFSKAEDNFWLRYSMVRDGGSIQTFLEHAGRSKYSILAIETTDGEVFGAFTSAPWKKDWNYFGTGESFLWKMRNPRVREDDDKNHKTKGKRNYHDPESKLDIYPCTGENEYIQLCHHDQIAVGGGCTSEIAEEGDDDDCDDDRNDNDNSTFRKRNFGHGLYIGDDMRQGTSSPCVTFRSPSLSKTHSDGSLFEIANLELWTLTPCTREEDADILERSIRFVSQHY